MGQCERRKQRTYRFSQFRDLLAGCLRSPNVDCIVDCQAHNVGGFIASAVAYFRHDQQALCNDLNQCARRKIERYSDFQPLLDVSMIWHSTNFIGISSACILAGSACVPYIRRRSQLEEGTTVGVEATYLEEPSA